MLYWDLIEEYLPDFEGRDDILFDDILFRFIHNEEVSESDLPALKELAKKRRLGKVFFALEKHLLNEAFDAYFEKELMPKIRLKQKECGSE